MHSVGVAVRGLGLPPVWRAGLIVILITILVAVACVYVSTKSTPEPVPSFAPVQLPTLGVNP